MSQKSKARGITALKKTGKQGDPIRQAGRASHMRLGGSATVQAIESERRRQADSGGQSQQG